jgi:predicted transposase/invertase (TIGR01784 family)
LWAKRGWNQDDKRIILLAIDYLMKLKNEDYAQQVVAHMELLKMKMEEKEMYVSVFERGYTAKGRAEGRAEGLAEGLEKGLEKGREEGRAEVARDMLRDGFPVEKVIQYTKLPREEIETLRVD